MKVKVLAGALLAVVACTAFAQHDHQQAQSKASKPEMDPAMMEAMMKAGMPGEPHKMLANMAGTWNAKVSTWMMPGADAMVMDGTSENKAVMGGRYLEQRFSGNFMGMPFEGVGYTGYDNVKKQYWGTWMDNMSTGMMMMSGAASDDGKTWTFTGTMADPMTGKDTKIDEKVTVIDADHHTLEMWGPGPDGKMYKTMEIAYSRKK
ncbi:MAG TPA: DUF1579 domain-containing protein [Thermoanaerobaculia bacterium]|nr:DUF1579 domain-containing protein [Thermoanaerobaculia bacterium]